MNKEISIVTFFFDTGRDQWTPDKGYPHYLYRTVDTYFERFSYMAQLDNEMVIYTQPSLVDRVKELRKGKENKTKVVSFDYHNMFAEEKAKISDIQSNPDFQSKINPTQKMNPEYWNADYIQIQYLKSFFVRWAIEAGHITNEQTAYLDFGYCRTPDKIPPSKKWEFDFGPKFNLFGYREYPIQQPISYTIFNNIVYILGAKQVGPTELWPKVNDIMIENMNELQSHGLIDDDQTLWLMAGLKRPDIIKTIFIPDHQQGYDSFVLFNNYNDKA